MSKDFNKPYDPKSVEEGIYQLWEKSGLFNPDYADKRGPASPERQRGESKRPASTRHRGEAGGSTQINKKNIRVNQRRNPRKSAFTIVMPPPNITGSLHMGHALNATIQDILIRRRRMEGHRALWLPGIDHAGIATQNVVERELKKEGINRRELGREKFLERVWQWKEKYGAAILDQLKKLGCSLDWSRTRFTMDEGYQEAVKAAFIHYYNRGWIYRGERTVNWCSRCGTSLSDLEIEYKEEEATMYYIKYGPLTIATVRPETKLGDTAVAVNPKDARYKKYIGKLLDIETVLGPAKMKVIADPSVDVKFGTGAMKVTPAHDMHDFELSEKHGLERKQVIGPDGKMTALAGKYACLKVHEARKQIVEDMKVKGLLVKTEPYKHNVAVCYRCGSVLEPMLSKQWFVRMSVLPNPQNQKPKTKNQKLGKSLRDLAIEAVKSGRVRFHPKRWEKIYFDWLKNIKDWCISRQIWWGHQLPVFFCRKKQEVITNYQLPISNENQKSKNPNIRNWKLEIGNSSEEQFVVSDKPPQQCPFCKQCSMQQAEDVLDTWFSSALWPFATLGWPLKKVKDQRLKIKSDLEKFYPTQVLSTDRGIINLWVARMIFSGLEFMGQAPFKDVIIHATILTKDGQRMSKSKGTGVDPLDLIQKYGADATRFGIIWQTMGTQDVRWSEEHVVAGRKFANKLWNASRFVLLNKSSRTDADLARGLTRKIKGSTIADKKILASLEKTKKEVSKLIDSYEFGQALHILYEFFWHEFCDSYLEKSKEQLTTNDQRQTTQKILFYVLSESLKLLHPFMPFITEAIYQKMELKSDKISLIIEKW